MRIQTRNCVCKVFKRYYAHSSSILAPSVNTAPTGQLILCGTPIGNLSDCTSRLHSCLSSAKYVYAEDTRRTKILINHLNQSKESESHGIINAPVYSYHSHSDANIRRELIDRASISSVVYVTDAGMPGISDPGSEIVTDAYSQNIKVDVIPGPSAVLQALVLSGFHCPDGAFAFLGFFPRTDKGRKDLFKRLPGFCMPTIHFEGPSRIHSLLDTMIQYVPNCRIAVCRELTKLHQEVVRGTPEEVKSKLSSDRGEFAVVIDTVSVDAIADDLPLLERYQQLIQRGYSNAKAFRELSHQLGMNKQQLKIALAQLSNDSK